jgi:D-hydroxyproline dehydrogenase subunit alpha
MTSDTCEAAIIGGGPAGLAAAAAMKACGVDVCLIDEQPRLGGQIYRQPPVGFRVDSWLAGKVYRRGKALLACVERRADLRLLVPATVWALFPAEPATGAGGHHVLYDRAGKLGRLKARYVLLATGCYEMPVPFPGWQLPGVMSAGGIQTLLKSQRVAAGGNVVLAGSHPLLLIAAEQLLGAGVRVAAVVLSQSPATAARALGSPASLLGAFGQLLHAGRCLSRLRRAGVPLMLGQVVSEALGTDAVEAVRIRRSDFQGEGRVLACDAVGVCYGFLASSELARQAGARSVWEAGSGWVVAADDFMRSSVPGVGVAGELIGVAGAQAAALSGEIAGLGIAVDCGRLAADAAVLRARALRRRLDRARRFGRLLSRLSSPAPQLLRRLATPATLLCRCEDVTVEELTAALQHDPGVASASAAKLLTRVGMGACQGRMCETAVRQLIAASRGSALSEIAGYVPRAPVKPVPLAAFAALAAEAGAMPMDPGARVA